MEEEEAKLRGDDSDEVEMWVPPDEVLYDDNGDEEEIQLASDQLMNDGDDGEEDFDDDEEEEEEMNIKGKKTKKNLSLSNKTQKHKSAKRSGESLTKETGNKHKKPKTKM